MGTYWFDILRLFIIPITFTLGDHTFSFSPLTLGIIVIVNCFAIALFNKFTGG